MKVIFLDWTGVLFTYKSALHCNGMQNRADSECVAALNYLVEKTGAEIVVCSEYRIHYELSTIRDLMAKWGIKKSPINKTSWNWDKAASINEFLKDCQEVKTYVILDDELKLDIYMDYRDFNGNFTNSWAGEIVKHIVSTKEEQGLTKAVARQAATMLTT